MMLIDTAADIVPTLQPKALQRQNHDAGSRAHADPGKHREEHRNEHDPGIVHAAGKELRNGGWFHQRALTRCQTTSISVGRHTPRPSTAHGCAAKCCGAQ